MDASLGSAMGRLGLDTSGFESGIDRAVTKADQLTSGIGSGADEAGRRLEKINAGMTVLGTGAVVAGTAMTGAFAFGVKAAMNFEAQMSAVASVSGASTEQLAGLREEALRLGKDTSMSASEAGAAMEIMLKAGADLESVMTGATQAAINLSEATGAPIEQSAEVAAAAMNIFGVSAEHAANLIAQSANASALDVQDWALALKYAGPVATSLGTDMDELAQVMVILGDASIKGETGGVALRNMLTTLADPAGDASAALAEYGVATHDANDNLRDLSVITEDLAGSWDTLSQSQKVQLAESIAGKQGLSAFISIMDAQTAAVKNGTNAFDDATNRMAATGTVSEQAAARMDNLAGAIETLKGTLETIAITFFSRVTPAIQMVVGVLETLGGVLLNTSPVFQTIVAAGMGIVGMFLLLGGGAILLAPQIRTVALALQALTNTQSTVAALRAIRVAMMAALGPIALVVAAAALLYAAYKTNFLGFGDGVRKVANEVKVSFENLVEAVQGVAGRVAKGIDTFKSAFTGMWDSMGGDDATGVVKAINQIGGVVTKTGKSVNKVSRILRSFSAALKSIGGDDTPAFLVKIARGLDKIAGAVDVVVRLFKEYRANGIDPVTAALNALRMGANALGFEKVARILYVLGGVTKNLAARFREFNAYLNPVTAALRAIASVFPVLAGSMEHVIDAVSYLQEAWNNLKVAFDAFMDGNFEEGFDRLGAALGNVGNALKEMIQTLPTLLRDVFEAIDWNAIGNEIATSAGNLWGFITESVSSIPWGAIGSALLSGAGIAISYIAGLASDIWGWIEDTVGDIPWNTIGEALKNGADTAISFITGLASDVWGWIKDAAYGIEWDAIGELLKQGADIAIAAIVDISTDIWGWIKGKAEDIPWTQIGTMLWAGAQVAVDRIVETATDIWGWIEDKVNDIPWGTIGETLKTSAETAVARIAEASTDVWEWIKDSAYGIPWDAIGDLLKQGADIAVGAIANLATDIWGWIKDKATEFDWPGTVTTLLSTAEVVLDTIVTRLGRAAGNIWAWINDSFPSWADVVTSLLSTAETALDTIAGRLGRAAGDIWAWISRGFPDWGAVVTALLSTAEVVLDTIVDRLGRAAGDIWGWIKDTAGSIKWVEIVEEVIGGIGDALGTLKTKIAEKAGDVWGFLKNPFGGTSSEVNVPQGMAPVVNTAASTTFDATGLAQGIADAIGKAFSQVNTQGVVSGIDVMFGKAVIGLGKQSEQMVAAASAAGESFAKALENYFINTASGATVAAGIENMFYKAAGQLAGTLDDDAALAGENFARAMQNYYVGTASGEGLALGIKTWIAKAVALVATGLTEVGTALGIAVENAGDAGLALLDGTTTGEQITSWLERAVGMASTTIDPAMKILADLIGTALDTNLGTALDTASTSVTTFVNDTIALLGGWQSGFVAIVTNTMEPFKSKVSGGTSTSKLSVTTFVNDTIGVMGGWKAGYLSIVTSTMEDFKSKLSGGTSTSKGSITTFTEDTKTAMGTWKTTVQGHARDAMSNVKSSISTRMTESTDAVRTMTLDTKTMMTGWAASMGSKATTAGQNVRTNLNTELQRATTAVRTHMDLMVSTVRSFGSNMYSAGRYVGTMAGDGVVSGLDAAHGRVASAAGRIINTVDATMRRVSRMRSPSKLTAEVGRMLTLGVGEGLTDAAATASVQAAAGAVIKSVDTVMRRLSKAVDWSQVDTGSTEGLRKYIETFKFAQDELNRTTGAWQRSRSGTFNRVAGNARELSNVIRDYLMEVVKEGEWGGDVLTNVPENIRTQLQAIGKALEGKLDADYSKVTAREAELYRAAIENAMKLAANFNYKSVKIQLPDITWLKSNKQVFTRDNQDAVIKYFQSMFDQNDMDFGNDFLGHIAGPWKSEVVRIMEAIGRDLAQGLNKGISAYAHLGSEGMVRMVYDGLQAAKASMGIRSPSQEMMTVGEMMARGLIIGLQNMLSRVKAMGAQLAEAAVVDQDLVATARVNRDAGRMTTPLHQDATFLQRLIAGQTAPASPMDDTMMRLMAGLARSTPAYELARQGGTSNVTVNMPITIQDSQDPRKTAEVVVGLMQSVAMQQKAERNVTLASVLGPLG